MSEPSIARGMSSKRHTLDDDSASRLLQGAIHPDDAPPGYGAVAGVLNSAARSLGPVDEDIAANTISAMVEVIRDATPAPETRRKSMLGKLLAGKALAAIAVVGLTATGAAAATGSLPDAAQSVVSDTVGKVGVNIPHPNHGKSAAHRQDGKHKPSDDDQSQPGDETKGMSGTVVDLKQQIEEGKLEGPLGQHVCKEASQGKCVHEDGDSGEDEGDTSDSGPSTENKGRNSDDPSGKSGADHGKPAEVTPPAAPDTPKGSIETGEENSERDLPSGKGKPE